MSQREIVVPKRRIIIPRVVIRERRAPPPSMRARLQPQHMRYEVGRYRERLRSGPGGLGRGRIWTPERVGEQHNLILDITYDNLIPTYGLTALAAYAAVGTGSSAPAANQQALDAQIARTNAAPSGWTDTQAVIASQDIDIQVEREFTPTQIGGQNVTEWGFAPDATGPLMTRELFRDGSGTPITLTLAADQSLRLIYAYRVSITPAPGAGQAFSFNLTNVGTFNGTAFFNDRNDPRNMLATLSDLVKGATSYLNYQHTSRTPQRSLYYYDVHDHTKKVSLPIQPYVSGARKRTTGSVTVATSAWNTTIYGLVIFNVDPNSMWIADFGGSFAKDNLHKLIVDPWDIVAW